MTDYATCAVCQEAVLMLYDGDVCAECWLEAGGHPFRLRDARVWASSDAFAEAFEDARERES